MAITIDKTNVEILSALAIEDLRGYAARHPEAHAAYLAIKQSHEKQPQKKQTRRSA